MKTGRIARSTQKKIAAKAQGKTFTAAQKLANARSADAQTQKMLLEIGKRTTQRACGRVLAELKITTKWRKERLHRLAQQTIGNKTPQQLKPIIDEIVETLGNPTTALEFIDLLEKYQRANAREMQLHKHIISV